MKPSFLQTNMRAPPPEDALEFILFEHLRHREMCRALDCLADAADFDSGEVARLTEFISVELKMHIFDEEEDLFPLLRRRCAPEDQIEAALARFDREHDADRDLSARVLAFLQTAIAEARSPSKIPSAPAALHAFAQNQRRHMMLENGVLIPLARRRLSKDDVAALGRRFAARRRPSAASSA